MKPNYQARTAYHEAGHAVAAVRSGRGFHYVTILPEEDSLGHIMYRRFSTRFRPDLRVSPYIFQQIEAIALCCFAGPAAEGMLCGKEFEWQGASKDHSDALTVLSYLDFEPKAVELHLLLCARQASNLVTQNKDSVRAVASALLERKRLSWHEVAKDVAESRRRERRSPRTTE